jgi:hypothetical protein
MGLGNFFRRVGSGISNVAGKVWSGAKNVGGKVWEGVKYVGKAAKPVINVAQKITGLTEKIPGMIGETSKWIRGGLDKVNGWIDMIPSGKIKDKLREASDDVGGVIDTGERFARDIGGKVIGGIEQAKPWVDFAGKITGAKMATGPIGGFKPKTAENSIQSQKLDTSGGSNWLHNRSGGNGVNIRNMRANARQISPEEASRLMGSQIKYM